MKRRWGLIRVSVFSFVGALLLSIALATPSQAHWADLAVANVEVGETTTRITLTFPTGLTDSADDNRDGTLSPTEVQAHQADLTAFLGDRIHLTSQGDRGVLTIAPSDTTALSPDQKVTAGTHSTLRLTYTWLKPVQGLILHYDLFLPGVPTARCLTTINTPGHTQSVIFSPDSKEANLMQSVPWFLAGGIPLAIAACFAWGAMHAMSPGHGKTIVGAYLVGAHATPQHAVFLGLTTTITHTAGVFALGLGTLLFSNFLPERLYPWLSFISGLIVVDIGLRQLISRLRQVRRAKNATPHSHSDHHHTDHPHDDHPPSDHQHNHSPAYALAPAHNAHVHAASVSHVPDRAPSQPHQTIAVHNPAHDHEHDHSHNDAHSHVHDRSHSHPHQTIAAHSSDPDHEHDHSHNDAHSHSHDRPHTHDHGDGHSHSHALPGSDGSPVTWRSLLALGISGGIVPCPSALVMLLSAIALGRVGFGLMMVLVFSLGLAGTLTALGLLMVSARRLFERVPTQIRFARFLPALSALVITLLGVGIAAQAVMQIGLLNL
ncbi:MAG: sulfite exporter TauE/SafE family protein [Stenomitos frigidus ULC029]